MKPAILCTLTDPPQVVRTLLETYYRFLGYDILYVCQKGDMVSQILGGTQLPPGLWYPTRESVYKPERIKFAIVEGYDEAWYWTARGIPAFCFEEVF